MPLRRVALALLALAVLTTVLVATLPARPAAAHTELTGSSVKAGQVLPAETAEVVLRFSGAVRPQLSTVVLTGPGGASGGRGKATLRGSDVVQALDAPLPAGAWTLAYRVVAVDGHPVTGSIPFTVAAAPATSSAQVPSAPVPGVSPVVAVPTPSNVSSPSEDGNAPVLPVAGAALGTGLLALLLLRRRRP